ncbi:MAG: glycosyltransferase [Chitinophagaceae bacterium]
MDVSIIIINYNTFQLTCNCIASIIQFTKNVTYEIILVDNASTECDPENFKKEFPQISLVKNTVNAGFAAGNNLGIQMAKGELILLLNSDTVLLEDSISTSVNFYRSHPMAGVIGCRMIYPDGSIQYTARKFRTIKWELFDLFRFIPYLMPYKKRARLMLGKYFRHDEIVSCDWLNGAFFLFKKNLLTLLPGNKLDERFFMYGEDQLWCEQISRQGLKNYFFSETAIVHINSGSTDIKKRLQLRKVMMKHELKIMKLRKGEGLYYFVFAAIFTAKESVRNLVKAAVFKFTGKILK